MSPERLADVRMVLAEDPYLPWSGPSMAEVVAEVDRLRRVVETQVRAAHRLVSVSEQYSICDCTCRLSTDQGSLAEERFHAAHVAAAVTKALEESR